MNLNLLLIIPLITAAAVLFTGGLKLARMVSFLGSLVQMAACFMLLFAYYAERSAGNTDSMLFQQVIVWFDALKINYHVGVDGVSIAMILLTSAVVLAGVLVSWNVEKMSKEYFFLLMLLAAGAYGFFISLDIFMMFFFLEVAVIPKFLLIGIWGSGKKELSAMKLALMLMAGSALVFIGMLGIYFNSWTGDSFLGFNLVELSKHYIPYPTQQIFFPFLFIGFGIFTALFPFHTWVPDGHSSAPTAASMFLAGISMKLGGYGCLRVAVNIMPEAAQEYSTIIILLSTIAIIYGAFATMMQTDLKYINAYSSISHCGFVILGIGMLTETAVTGAVMQMVSHGLMTALFFAAIGMIYERSHTREVKQLGGLLKVMPFISTVFVIAGLCSLGLPGFSGFVAEMTIFMGSWEKVGWFYRTATILACASIVVTAVYILRATGRAIMGPLNEEHSQLTDATWNEKLAAAVLIIGIVAMGIAPFWVHDLVAPGSAETVIRIVGSRQ
jgi:NADH-quinone oxidoreductase subunit M